MDILLALIIAPLVLPLVALIAIGLWAAEGGSPFFLSERMSTPQRSFSLWKFRTMRHDPQDSGVSGGDKSNRISPLGALLRRTRLDELPQWWNILRGDIGFVGPRPPLRSYVERFPALYQEVLRDRPGVTGMATLVFHKTEERLLATCRTAEETDAVYSRRCVPRKARIDILYARRRTLCSDVRLLVATVLRQVPPH